MNNEIVIDSNKSLSSVLRLRINIYLVTKRIIDIIFSVIGLFLLIPIIITVKIAYVLSGDFKSIFYNHERIGKNGKLFKMYKFRTMVTDAEEILEKLLEEDSKIKEEYDKYKKIENDLRVTKVGRILRKFSIDEFPQFINVFIGNMSLVGPRPYLYREKKDMGRYFNIIKQVKPGITGYWQVSGRSNKEFKERLVLDEEYIGIRNIKLDLKIISMTLVKVIKSDGVK